MRRLDVVWRAVETLTASEVPPWRFHGSVGVGGDCIPLTEVGPTVTALDFE